MSLNVGDRIRRRDDPLGLVLEIVAVRLSGYDWRYVPQVSHPPGALDLSPYSSDGGVDPFFQRGWVKVGASQVEEDVSDDV